MSTSTSIGNYFVQVEDDRAFGKNVITPVDQDPLDMRLGFLAYVNATEAGTFKARVGTTGLRLRPAAFRVLTRRTECAPVFRRRVGRLGKRSLALHRFLSQPVQYDLISPFDDTSNSHFRFHTLRVERQVLGTNELSAYYSFYQKDNVRLPRSPPATKSATCSMFASPGTSTMSIGISRRWARPA